MSIYGVGLLALCYIVGKFFGRLLGVVVGLNSDIGGVGFAMLLLIIAVGHCKKKGWLTEKSRAGIAFWKSMYQPVVVALASIQDVRAALKSGVVAIGGSILGVVIAFALIPVLAKLFAGKGEQHES